MSIERYRLLCLNKTALLSFSSLAVLVVLLGVGLLLQTLSGRTHTEVGADEADEPAHYVTSVMVRDYLATGLPGDPRQFAEAFYIHYPKVAFGMWPPFFHLSTAVWMLVAGTSRQATLMWMALWAAFLGLSLYLLVSRRYGKSLGIAAALTLISLPAIQDSMGTIMLDLMLALLSWAAVSFLIRYFKEERVRDANLFGRCATLCILTKYNAIDLALVPLTMTVLTRKWYLLRRLSFWSPAVIVLFVCIPWYLTNAHNVTYAMKPVPTMINIPEALRLNTIDTTILTGLLAIHFIIGFVIKVGLPFCRSRVASRWAGAAALLFSVFIFHSIAYPISEIRYLLPAAVPMLFFAVAGAVELTRIFTDSITLTTRRRIALLILITPHLLFTFALPRVTAHIFSAQPDSSGSAVLVSSSGLGEGMFISEMVMRRLSPCYVLRATKGPRSHRLDETRIHNQNSTADDTMLDLSAIPVNYIVLHSMAGVAPRHHQQLLEVISRYPQSWQLVAEVKGSDKDEQTKLYRYLGSLHGHLTVTLDMSFTLGREISKRLF